MADDEATLFEKDIDTSKPNVARAYDYYLGGGTNFTADREFAKRILEGLPEARTMAIANRQFQGRAVRLLAEQGVRQFLDLGAGIPTVNPTHEAAREVQPDAKVVYVDSEAVAVTHGQLQLAQDPGCRVVQAELQDVDKVLAEAGQLLDFTEPVAVMLLAIMHFVPDTDDPKAIIGRYASACPGGSYLILSHGTGDGSLNEQVTAAAGDYTSSANYSAHLRSKEAIRDLVEPYELLEPGIVWTPQWRPDAPVDTAEAERTFSYGAVGRKR